MYECIVAIRLDEYKSHIRETRAHDDGNELVFWSGDHRTMLITISYVATYIIRSGVSAYSVVDPQLKQYRDLHTVLRYHKNYTHTLKVTKSYCTVYIYERCTIQTVSCISYFTWLYMHYVPAERQKFSMHARYINCLRIRKFISIPHVLLL